MSGPIPEAVRAQMQPPPGDWRITVMEDDDRIWWRGRVDALVNNQVQQIQVEYGFSKRSGHDASEIRTVAWEIAELARLGRVDLLNWARKDRHVGRPGTKPTINAQNMGHNTAPDPSI